MNDPAPEEQPAPEERRLEEEYPLQFCPACSTRLAARSCKLICTLGSYYMSCSDFV